MKAITNAIFALLLVVFALACQGGKKAELAESVAKADTLEVRMPELKITSSAFIHEGMIPARYTCDGEDISPEIMWRHLPKEAKSVALICDDPDAPSGTWVHWVIYNIPATDSGLPAMIKLDNKIYTQGKSSWGKNCYGGPCPPSGTHRYYFKVYALDKMLDLKSGASKEILLKAMEKHIVAQGELMGKYKRQK